MKKINQRNTHTHTQKKRRGNKKGKEEIAGAVLI